MEGEDLRCEEQLIDRMVELQRTISRTQAQLAEVMAIFADNRRGNVLLEEFASDEIAAALTWSRGWVQDRVRLVRQVRAQLPVTWAAWGAGAVDEFKVVKIVQAVNQLADPDRVPEFEAAAAQAAQARSWGQLGSWLSRQVARLGPVQQQQRYRRSYAERRVQTSRELDGMGSLWAYADALELTRADYRLTRLAERLGGDDPRSMDQRRADILLDLLLGRPTPLAGSEAEARGQGDPPTEQAGEAARGAEPGTAVAVVVPVQSLVGLDDTPGELADGSGSVPASVVRQVAGRPGTLFYRLLTDERGTLLDVSQLGRFPTRLLGFAVDVRDRTCRFPGCRRPATGCDCDHTVRHPEGSTNYLNLGCLCRRHHRCKHTPGYRLEQVEPGVFQWTMPTGHNYTIRPDPLPAGRWPDHPDSTDPPSHLADLDLDLTEFDLAELDLADEPLGYQFATLTELDLIYR